jgi:hypothetical protein
MVDGIGKGGGVPPPAGGPKGPGGPSRPEGTGKAFDVQKTDAPRDAQAVQQTTAVTATPLEQLKTGKIDFERYLDMKVEEATSHLDGMTPVHLDTIRSMLRERMATDPELVDLLKQATGQAPSPPVDGSAGGGTSQEPEE